MRKGVGSNAVGANRRQLLKAIGAAAATGAVGGLAGCTERLGLGNGLGASADGFGSLAYEPGEIDDIDRYDVQYLNPKAVGSAEDELPDDMVGSYESRHEALHEATDIDFDETASIFSFRTTTVLWVDHATADVADELDDNGFDDVDPVGEYKVYERDDGTSAVAFDGSRVIETKPTVSEDDPVDVFETVHDASIGEESRYTEANAAVDTLLGALDGADVFQGGPHEPTTKTTAEAGRFESEVARGSRVAFDTAAGTAAVEFVLVFEAADDVPTDDITAWTETAAFKNYDDTSVASDGTVATVSTTVDMDDVSLSVPHGQSAVNAYIPNPSSILTDKHMKVFQVSPSSVAANQGLEQSTADLITEQSVGIIGKISGIEPSTLETTAAFGPAAVGLGDFDGDSVRSGLTDEGYEQSGSHEGFDIYTMYGTSVALRDGVIIGAEKSLNTDTQTTDIVRTAIDASLGNAPRYTEQNEDYDLLTQKLGQADYVTASTQERTQYESVGAGEFAGVVAKGFSLRFEGSTARFSFVFVYDSPDSVDMSAVEEFVNGRKMTGLFSDTQNVRTRKDGRTVTVTASTTTATI